MSIMASPGHTRHVHARPSIPEKWITLARDGWPDGDTSHRYSSARSAAYAYLKACARHGIPEDETLSYLENGPLYRDAYATRTTKNGTRRHLTQQAAMDDCLDDWAKACRQVKDQPLVMDKTGARHIIGEIRAAARHYPWTGRSAIRDKIVLHAILDAADRLETLNPTISVRSLCESTPYRSDRTIRNSIKALRALGWVTPDRADCKPDQPSILHIHTPMFERVGTTAAAHRASRGESMLRLESPPLVPVRPSADQDGMHLAMVTSPCGQAVHAALWERPQSRNLIAKRAGVATKTAGKWLVKLSRLGLAREGAEGWVLGDTDRRTVTFERGAELMEFDRSQRHAKARDDWRNTREIRAKSRVETEKRIRKLAAERRARNDHKCVATTKRGDPCPGAADEWGLCVKHDPAGNLAEMHPAYRERLLAQAPVRAAFERRPVSTREVSTTVPSPGSRRGPETRAAAVNPPLWGETCERMNERRDERSGDVGASDPPARR